MHSDAGSRTLASFEFNGVEYRASTKTRNREIAERIEREARRDLELGTAGLQGPAKPLLFTDAATAWLTLRKQKVAAGALAANTVRIDETNLDQLRPVFGKKILSQVTSEDVAAYQSERLRVVAPKTVNLELGTLRMVLKRHGFWERIGIDIGMSKTPHSIGRVITLEEQTVLFAMCETSRSRQLLPIVTLAFQTGVRFGPLRIVRWRNVDLKGRCIQWGKDKTPAGTGRIIPLNARAVAALTAWAEQFPDRQPEHFVFPSERCGASTHHFETHAPIHYNTDPTKPIGSIKTAWVEAKKRCGIVCRFHDIRHTAVTAMVNDGIPLTKIAKVVGWSPSQTVRMSLVYSHFTVDDLRDAVEALDATRNLPRTVN
jgi:integrase